MNFCLRISILLLALCQMPMTFAQLSQDTAARVDALFAGRSQDEPGGVLIITRYGKQIYRKTFGVTNLENPSPITGEAIFPAASVSKQFTAAGVLLLVKDGKLSLDDDVKKFIPELPDYGEKITVRHLLTHTSGLKDWWNITYITSRPSGYSVFDQEFALRYICRQKSLNYTPGERYSYTNTGYDLAAVIIERVTGKSFPDYINEQLLQPAGMTRSSIRRDFQDVVRNIASGYYTAGNRYVRGYVLDETYGAAGLLTTAGDLAKWNEFIHTGKIGRSIAELREERFVLNNGDTIAYANGGINVTKVNGTKEITHSGLEGGFRALCTYYPEKRLSVTYMSNNKDISTVALRRNIAEIFFGRVASDDPLEEILASRAGREKSRKSAAGKASDNFDQKKGIYLNLEDESDFLTIREHSGRLLSYAAELTPVASDLFTYENSIYQFMPCGDTVILHNNGAKDTYYRVPWYIPDMDDLSLFTGTYYSDDADVALEIRKAGNRLEAHRSGGDYVMIYPVFRLGDIYAFRGFDHGLRATYYFKKEDDQSIRQLIINLPRAAGIPFLRQGEF